MPEPTPRAGEAAPARDAGAQPGLLRLALSWCRDWGGLLSVVLALYTAAFLSWLVFAHAGEVTVTRVADTFFIPVLPAAALLAWRAGMRPQLERRTKLAWRIVGLGFLLWGLGDILWAYYELVLESEAFPSLADAVYLAGYPVMLVGLLLFPSAPRDGTERWKFLLDAGIVFMAALMAIWHFGLRPIAQSGAIDLTTVLSAAYPIGDVVLMFGVAMLLFRRPPRGLQGALTLLQAGLVATIAADVYFAYQSVQETYSTGGWPDKLFAVADMLFIAGAQYQYWSAGRGEERPEASARPRRSYNLFPYVAVAVGYGVLFVAGGHEFTNPTGGLLVVAGLVTGLVIARQIIALRESDQLLTEDLRRSEGRFRSLVQNATDVILVIDGSGNIAYESPAVERVLGYTPEYRVGANGFDFVHPDDLPQALETLSAMLEHPAAERALAVRGRHADGSWRWLEVSVRNLLGDPDVRGMVVNYSDITERRALEEQLTHQAFHDSLTNLANRALFKNRVEHALARGARYSGAVSVLFLDLDDFKTVNDGLGHAAGDELLVAVAGRLTRCLREMDTAARLGGDEFAVLLEDARSGQAQRTAERILETLKAPFSVLGCEVFTGASIGIAARTAGAEGPEELLRNADVAMYMAKSRGKDRWEMFDPGMYLATVTRLEMKADLQRALEQDGLVLHYQPIVSMEDGGVRGVEALLRFQHPDRGLVPPLEFISIAEETGLIVPIGRWVLNKACLQMKEWQQCYPRQTAFGISVNLSPRQLMDPGLLNDVLAALRESGLRAEDLLLEITESTLLDDSEAMIARLGQLKSLGVRLAIDDFGTGYSSLSYLQRFPIDFLKIDKTFVDQIHDGSGNAAVAHTIIELAHMLQLKTIAEGVEQAVQAERLLALHCDLAQGYLFSVPLDRDAMSTLLARSRTEQELRLPV